METTLNPLLLSSVSSSIAPCSRWVGLALTGLTMAFLLFDSVLARRPAVP